MSSDEQISLALYIFFFSSCLVNRCIEVVRLHFYFLFLNLLGREGWFILL